MRVVGVDGCRGGWLAAIADASRVRWLWSADIATLLVEPADAVAIDIPIGLPDRGRRDCDLAARRRLGRRGVTVFPAPVRAVLDCTSYADARAVLAALGGPSMSAQAYGILRAVRQVDTAVTPADEPRVVEAHPELAFAMINGGPALAPKRTPLGRDQRLGALRPVWPGVAELVAAAPYPARADDALDALACAWVARRWAAGEATVLGGNTRDSHGLTMRIVT